jgi:hypothetical protein
MDRSRLSAETYTVPVDNFADQNPAVDPISPSAIFRLVDGGAHAYTGLSTVYWENAPDGMERGRVLGVYTDDLRRCDSEWES